MTFLDTVQLGLSSALGERSLDIYDKLPEIFMGIGFITFGGALITSSIAGSKVEGIIEEHLAKLEEIKNPVEVKDVDTGEVVNQENAIKRAVTKQYGKTVGKVVVLYAPTALLAGVSCCSFAHAHSEMSDRLTSATAYGLGIKQAFDTYVKNNIELNGEESHKACMYGFKEEPVVNEKGEEMFTKKVPKEFHEDGPDTKYGDYQSFTIYFNATTTSEYDDNASMNEMLIRQVERNTRQLFHARHWVTVNDVEKALGVEQSIEGMELGWYDDGESIMPIFDIDDETWLCNQDFLNGKRNAPITIKLNIHGNVRILRREALKKIKESRM